MNHLSKTELRKQLRRRRNSLNPSQQEAAAQSIVAAVIRIPAWADAQKVAIYMANDGEIDPLPLADVARTLGKQIYLPVIEEDDHLHFARWNDEVELVRNRYGIPEPPRTAPHCPVHELDIVFVPLVGFDLYCNRLGMGGGYYDRALCGDGVPLTIGLAHELQRVDQLPGDEWDIAMDFIATEAALYRSRGEKTAEQLFGDNNPGM